MKGVGGHRKGKAFKTEELRKLQECICNYKRSNNISQDVKDQVHRAHSPPAKAIAVFLFVLSFRLIGKYFT